MRVAVPTKNGEIFLNFEKSEEFTIYDVEIAQVHFKKVISTKEAGENGLVSFLVLHSVHVLLCGNIKSEAKNALREKRIELIHGAFGNASEMLVKYLSGEQMKNFSIELNHYESENMYEFKKLDEQESSSCQAQKKLI